MDRIYTIAIAALVTGNMVSLYTMKIIMIGWSLMVIRSLQMDHGKAIVYT
jgi:hypothetical protein